jgi:hypothetical protein
MNELLAAYHYLSKNWVHIQGSTNCGCCSCLETFAPDAIIAWTGLDMSNFNDPAAANSQTAMCPRCGSESVLGDKTGFPVSQNFLVRMNEAWFQRTLIRKPK